MSEFGVFRWLDGYGGLVLSGGPDELSDIRAQAISRISIDGGIAYIGLDEDDLDDLLDDMGELGAPTGFLVNVLTEDDDVIRNLLSTAAMVFVPGIYELAELKSSLLGAALQGMRIAFERGAIVLAEGDAAALFGQMVLLPDDKALEGFNWLDHSIIVPGITSIAESPQARIALANDEVSVAVGIGAGSALVLATDQQVETWGEGQVTIALGREAEGS